MATSGNRTAGRMVGRYALYDELGSGGMATVYLGRLCGPARFSPIVAVKALHPQLAKDPDFVKMFLDEARLAARIRHPNIVPVIDVHVGAGELCLVLEYVRGESLNRLIRGAAADGQPISPAIASAIVCDMLEGLHAAHEATDEEGKPLGIVHRDVSPHNVLVGVDGTARVFDFGVAKAAGRMQTTQDGQVKGKLAYMAPEQLRGESVNRQADLYAAAVVLWEMLTGEHLFGGDNEGQTVERVLFEPVPAPSQRRGNVPAALDAVVLRGLARERTRRFGTAKEMVLALEQAAAPAARSEVGGWVEVRAVDGLEDRARRVAAVEASPATRSRWTARTLVPLAAALVLLGTVGIWLGARSRARAMVEESSAATGSPPASIDAPPAPSSVAKAPLPTPQRRSTPSPARAGARPWYATKHTSSSAAPAASSSTAHCARRNADGFIEFDTQCLRAAQHAP
jgi:serine/threonine protein kinase